MCTLIWYVVVFKTSAALSLVTPDLYSRQQSSKWLWKATDTVNYWGVFFLCVVAMNFKNEGICELLGSSCNLIYISYIAESKTYLKYSDWFLWTYRILLGKEHFSMCSTMDHLWFREKKCLVRKKNLRHVLEIESISIALEIGYGSKKIEFAPSGQII